MSAEDWLRCIYCPTIASPLRVWHSAFTGFCMESCVFYSSWFKTNCSPLFLSNPFVKSTLSTHPSICSQPFNLLVPVISQADLSIAVAFLSYASPGLSQVLMPLSDSRSEWILGVIDTQKYSPWCLMHNSCLSWLHEEFLSPNPLDVAHQATAQTLTFQVSKITHSP